MEKAFGHVFFFFFFPIFSCSFHSHPGSGIHGLWAWDLIGGKIHPLHLQNSHFTNSSLKR